MMAILSRSYRAIGAEELRSGRTRSSLGQRGTGVNGNKRRASAKATSPDARVPAMAAISGASCLAPSANAMRRATAVPKLSVRPRE